MLLFALAARRKLNELSVQFDNVTTACQFYNAILDSLNIMMLRVQRHL